MKFFVLIRTITSDKNIWKTQATTEWPNETQARKKFNVEVALHLDSETPIKIVWKDEWHKVYAQFNIN